MTTHSITLAHWLALHTETALASVLLDLAHASTEIAGLIRGGALTGALGSLDNVNVQGKPKSGWTSSPTISASAISPQILPSPPSPPKKKITPSYSRAPTRPTSWRSTRSTDQAI